MDGGVCSGERGDLRSRKRGRAEEEARRRAPRGKLGAGLLHPGGLL